MAWRKEDGWGKAWREGRMAEIKKKRETERGRGQLGESAVCPWVLPDRPGEWGLYSLPSYVNGGFSLLAIRHCTERPWQALYEPPARIIPEPTIMRPAGGEGEVAGGLPCRQWKCSVGRPPTLSTHNQNISHKVYSPRRGCYASDGGRMSEKKTVGIKGQEREGIGTMNWMKGTWDRGTRCGN